jgi:trehalose 6-phosphate phosphatase
MTLWRRHYGMDERLRKVLSQRPCGVMTDIDGTISPIAPTPDAAYVTAVAQAHLARLAEHLDLVAAISGRAAADAARLVGLPQLTYIGNHGLEVWENGAAQPAPVAEPFVATIRTVLQEAEARLQLPGVLFEDKGVTASVHYRQTENPQAAEAEIGAVLEELTEAHGLRLTGGRMVWEIRPPLEVNKGVAVRRLVEQHGLRGAIFLGDDRTDADAFAVLHELRGQGTCTTLAIGVTGPDTPAVVRETADVLVDGIEGIERVLGQMVEILERST